MRVASSKWQPRSRSLAFLLALLVLAVGPSGLWRSSAQASDDSLGGKVVRPLSERQAAALPSEGHAYYLPLISFNSPWYSPLGVESNIPLNPDSTLLQRATELQVGWSRLNGRISWADLQPTEGGPIRWELLASFEDELRALNNAHITPLVVIDDQPNWATAVPNRCAAIRADKFDEFAVFVRALVARYKEPEFNVHHWELGNEPDVDPRLVAPDSVFGCWGNIDDPFYGGRHYGDMLKVVAPAIRAEDLTAKIWIGGLLLNLPDTTNPNHGKPERFLQGILEAGAAPYFDIVPYHVYPPYLNRRIDYDNAIGGAWDAWGGGVIGKARFLREMMARYGVSKPVFLNEGGFMCPEYYSWCVQPDAQYYQVQASYIVRSFTRGMANGISGFMWYTLNGPAWRYSGLLDGQNNPTLPFIAYQQLITQLQYATYHSVASYGAGVEGYIFKKGPSQVHVVWAIADQTLNIAVPQAKFVAAYTQQGTPITPTPSGSDYVLQARYEPIYLIRQP